ncbi:MAG: MBOAT family O-acyltransferase [Maricaulaceae bacterium]
MVFSSIEFLFYFLPIALIGYFLVPRLLKNLWLLLVSLVFYIWGVGAFVFVLLGSIAVNYALGLIADRAREAGKAARVTAAVAATVVINLALLGWFKYANFGVDQVNALLGAVGQAGLDWTDVALPIGISFFTFQSMSYVFDVAAGRARAMPDPIAYAAYIVMFPQLVAGPIVRYAGVAEALAYRKTTALAAASGARRFALGLIKIVVVADTVGQVADACFAAPANELTAPISWLGVAAYTLQIYFDFSGYSDMAVGLGRILGFDFPENFNRPYSAISVTDFWRRWHMSLSSWFRDYVYIPLGGNRGGSARTYANLWIVFLLTGLWHGANWTFIVWGVWHGALLVLERGLGLQTASGLWVWPRRALTLVLVMAGWVVFRAPDLGYAAEFYAAMVRFDGGLSPEVTATLSRKAVLVLALGSLIVLAPPSWTARGFMDRTDGWGFAARWTVLGLGLPYAMMLVVSGAFTAFLYFQF